MREIEDGARAERIRLDLERGRSWRQRYRSGPLALNVRGSPRAYAGSRVISSAMRITSAEYPAS